MAKLMSKVAIVHGTGGSSTGNWFPWIAAELGKYGAQVIVPQMPTPEGQSLESWLSTFQEKVGPLDSSTTVIGHSVGAVFLLRLLERLQSPIGCSVFVAGLTGSIGIPEYDTLNASFVGDPYDWTKVRRNAGHVLCLSGENDPYVPLAQGLEIGRNLGVEPLVIKEGGHLNAEFGYTTFPLLLEALLRVAD